MYMAMGVLPLYESVEMSGLIMEASQIGVTFLHLDVHRRQRAMHVGIAVPHHSGGDCGLRLHPGDRGIIEAVLARWTL